MADDNIPEDLRDLLLRAINSIAQLEALLLLRRNSEATWTSETVARRLYISETEASAVLDHLSGVGLISCQDKQFRFADIATDTHENVDRLADFYALNLIAVTNLIHSKPRRLREFSDAFRLRKDRP